MAKHDPYAQHRAAVRLKWKRVTAFRLGASVGLTADGLGCPYKPGSREDANYRGGREWFSRDRLAQAVDGRTHGQAYREDYFDKFDVNGKPVLKLQEVEYRKPAPTTYEDQYGTERWSDTGERRRE